MQSIAVKQLVILLGSIAERFGRENCFAWLRLIFVVKAKLDAPKLS